MSQRKPKAIPSDPVPTGEGPGPESWFEELTRALGWNPMTGSDLGPVLESCSKAADSWVAANRIALGAALAVAECQFRVLCQVLEDASSASTRALRADPANGAFPDAAWQAVRGFERLQENMRELTTIVARSQVEIADTLTRRMVEMVGEVEGQLARLKQ